MVCQRSSLGRGGMPMKALYALPPPAMCLVQAQAWRQCARGACHLGHARVQVLVVLVALVVLALARRG